MATDAEAADFSKFLDSRQISEHDRVIRRIALRGFATDGVALARADLMPEITITADGVYWSGARLVAVTNLLHVKPELLLGTNGAGPSQDEFAALSDRNINKIVIALNQLSSPQRQAVAKSVLSMVRAFGAKV